jgi:hypothetical protein
VKEELNSRNLLYSGQHGAQLRRTRDEFARRWRDRKRASDRRLAELQEAEGISVKAFCSSSRAQVMRSSYSSRTRRSWRRTVFHGWNLDAAAATFAALVTTDDGSGMTCSFHAHRN